VAATTPVPGSGLARVLAAPGFALPSERAQSARSYPLSASERAWATRRWFVAMMGSVCERTVKASINVVSNSKIIMAIGSAMPRSS
jgi:hypothetical protein